MLSLEVGGGGAGSSSSVRAFKPHSISSSKEGHDRLRAMSSGLSLSLESSFPARTLPVQLDLLPRSPQQPSLSSASQISRQQPQRSPAAPPSNECLEIVPVETNSNSSRGGCHLDMNEIPPSDCAASSPRSSLSPPFPLDMRRGDRSPSPSIKRERASGAGVGDACEASSRGSDEEDGAPRKKLRLSKEQSALLEESFKEHSTLNPKQKNALAKQLNLRPRQVEVWFQNRRARTKLKQTEIDCELLKRCCETLTEENRRLQKEVQELRAIKVPPPCVISQDFYMPLPAATLTMCPSCERLATVDGRSAAAAAAAASLPFKPQHQQQQPPSQRQASPPFHFSQQQQHHHHHKHPPPAAAAACLS